MKIGSREVGRGNPCFVVAEAGLSHGGDADRAFELVDAAVDGLADAVKFQIYRAGELVHRKRSSEWYERYREKELSYDVFVELQRYADERGILFFATPHTLSGLGHLIHMDVPVFKIGSGEKGSDLFGRIMDVGKPVIISTGMREQSEVLDLVSMWGGERTAFLHCVTQYSVFPKDANLGFLRRLGRACDRVGSVMGYSCHVEGSLACEMAVAMGAKVIEKHLKLEDSTGQDVACSLSTEEFEAMVRKIREIEVIVGSEDRIYTDDERQNEQWALKGKDGKRPL